MPRSLTFVLLTSTLMATFVQTAFAQAVVTRPVRQPPKVVSGSSGIVVCETPLGAEVGGQILAQGGNAVDAAIATALALEVTWPEAGNIGGGGFMMVAPPDQEVMCVEYRERAPLSVNEKSFVGWKNRRHPMVAGVPGMLRGMELAHRKYGKLSWSELVVPSVKLARDGIIVDEYLAYSLNSVLRLKSVKTEPLFAEFRRVYGHPDGRLWQKGDRLVQPDLASTLQLIADDGADAFYLGAIARLIVKEMERNGGLIHHEDLESYTAQLRPAISGIVGGYTVFGSSPPSSGGISVLNQLRILEALHLEPSSDYWSTQNVHLMTEAMRRTFRDRAAYLGDPDFVPIPEKIFNPEHAALLATTIDPQKATRSRDIADGIDLSQDFYESTETTHFSVLDKDGMAVSNTYTLEGNFGCRIVIPGAGFVLNNEMGDFNWSPGFTDPKGTIGTAPNRIEAGKRMLSSQSPTIVKKDGQVVLIIGSPGGRTIINTVSEILVQTLLFDRTLKEAIDGPRFHHQWFPDVITFESDDNGLFSAMDGPLKAMGHHPEYPSGHRQGSAHGIQIDPNTGKATGIADWRRGGGAYAVAL